jgi:hypothetical protein
MKFILTEQWLKDNYGSDLPHDIAFVKDHLQRFGTNVPNDKLDKWSHWKHLSEFQQNNPNLVEIALSWIGKEFKSELYAHREIGLLRYPKQADGYLAVDRYQPKTILELGLGGDMGISTGTFLSYLEEVGGKMTSVDLVIRGKAYDRYKKFPFWIHIHTLPHHHV